MKLYFIIKAKNAAYHVSTYSDRYNGIIIAEAA
jgi:hypothetical protein